MNLGPYQVDDGDPPALLGARCPGCGLTAFPAPDRCPACLSDLQPLTLSPTGTLYSYSVVHAAPPGWPTPYVVGYVDVPEGARVFAHLPAGYADQLTPDLRVRVHLEPLDDGGFIATWAPVEESANA